MLNISSFWFSYLKWLLLYHEIGLELLFVNLHEFLNFVNL